MSLIANAKRNSIKKPSYCSLERELRFISTMWHIWALKRRGKDPDVLLKNTNIRSRALVSRRCVSECQRIHLILFVRYQLHFCKRTKPIIINQCLVQNVLLWLCIGLQLIERKINWRWFILASGMKPGVGHTDHNVLFHLH